MTPFLPLLFVHLGGAGNVVVPLRDVAVLGTTENRPRLVQPVNLLGMDLVEALGARLFLDAAAHRGHMEWGYTPAPL
jgi:hypothetical protein